MFIKIIKKLIFKLGIRSYCYSNNFVEHSNRRKTKYYNKDNVGEPVLTICDSIINSHKINDTWQYSVIPTPNTYEYIISHKHKDYEFWMEKSDTITFSLGFELNEDEVVFVSKSLEFLHKLIIQKESTYKKSKQNKHREDVIERLGI